MMDGMGGMGCMMICMLLWGVISLALLALIVIGLVWLLRKQDVDRPDPAEQQLRHRFANGDIDAEEYQRRIELLRRRV